MPVVNWQIISSTVVLVADAATIVRALLRPHREPASRLAWIMAILALPIAGVILYLLLGETRISGAAQRSRERNRLAAPATARKFRMQRQDERRCALGAVRARTHRQSP